MPETPPLSEAEFARARRAVERGWVTQGQVEAALVARDRDPSSRLLAQLPLTPEQIRELDESDGAAATLPAATERLARPVHPPEVAEALKDPRRRIGRFVLVNLIGKGGMGMVFRGWEPELRQWVALKFLKQIGDDTARAYFKREAQLAAGLDHPNIAKIYEIGEHEGSPFIAMQFVDGEPLSTARRGMKLEAKIDAVRKIAEAVKYAHERRVIHRDLKPANVMIDRHGQVYVMDFGLAKETAVEGESIGGSSLVVGTPSYMAPEQAKGKANARSDLYGIGAILYELITGKPPFVGETSTDVIMQVVTQEPLWPRKLSPTTPEDVEAIILHALEKDPGRRYADAAQLIEDLDAFAQKNPLKSARRPTFGYILGKKIRKQPLLWGTSIALLLAIAAGAVFGVSQLLRARREAEHRLETERAAREADTQARREIEKERDQANERLAYSFILRARQAAASRDSSAEALLYAEANAIHSSELTRPDALRSAREICTLRAVFSHENGIKEAVLSPDGRRLVTADKSDRRARLWDVATGEPVGNSMADMNVHVGDSDLYFIGFTPDGKEVVTSTEGERVGDVQLWDSATGNLVGESMTHEWGVSTICFSPDGTRLLTEGGDKVALLWDARSGKLVGKPMAHTQYVSSAGFSPDGKRIVTACYDKVVRMWDAATNEAVGKEMAHPAEALSAAFSPDGKRILTACKDHAARLWDAATGAPMGQAMRHEDSLSAAFSPDGERIVTASADRTARLWDGRSGEPVGRVMKHDLTVTTAAFVPGGKEIVTIGEDRAVSFWDAATGEPLRGSLRHQTDLALGPDDKRFITTCDDATARLWERPGPDSVTVASRPGLSTDYRVHSPDRSRVLQATDFKSLRLWDKATGRPIGKTLAPEEGFGFGSVVFTPDGRRIVTWLDKVARLWDAATGEPIGKPMRNPDTIRAVVFDRDGTRMLAGGRGATIWDTRTADLRATLNGENIVLEGTKLKGVFLDGAAFSTDGERIATWLGRTVWFWDARTGEPAGKPIRLPEVGFRYAVFRPGARTLLTLCGDQSARLWDSETGAAVGKAMRHERTDISKGDSFITAAEFSPDGKRVVTGSFDKTARLWDGETGEAVGRVMIHEDMVWRVAFSPDGERVMTVCRNNEIRFWDAASGEPLGKVIREPGEVLDAIFGADGAHLIVESDEYSVPYAKRRVPDHVNHVTREWDLSFLTASVPPDLLLLRVRVATGCRLDRFQQIEVIPPDEWRALKQELDAKEKR